jgi:hypothetical protein
MDGDYINQRTHDVVVPLFITNFFGFDARETRLLVSWMIRNVSLVASRRVREARQCFDPHDSLYKQTTSRGHPSSLRLRLWRVVPD